MKKIEIVKIPAKKAVAAKPATTKKIEKTVCDFCDSSLPNHGSFGWYPNCSLCGRDTCRKHNTPDPHEYGDYPDWYCQICYNLRYNVHQDEYLAMIDRHDKEEEEFMKKLKEESLASSID